MTAPDVTLPDFTMEVERILRRVRAPRPRRAGTLMRVVGLTLRARGIVAPLGALCHIESAAPGVPGLEAEVVGFHEDMLDLMPFNEPVGISPGARVVVSEVNPQVQVGHELLGRVIDARGMPLDGLPAPYCDVTLGLRGLPINPMERGPVDQILDVGVRSINGLLTIGRGQRMGLIAGSGVGKSVLMAMLTRGCAADVVVIGLIGERGREVREFVTQTLEAEGLARAVVIASPADQSPVLRLRAVHMTHLIAEYFRDQGLHVLMLVDSLTRVAHAQREIGLAIGEPPTAKGYPPSVYALLPGLIERSGMGRGGHGSITAIYTVLAEGDDAHDPVVDIARASLDGQVMLTRRLADAAHYPAIDLMGSISRIMPSLVDAETLRVANRFRRYWTLYQQNEELIQVGAYESGSDPALDQAIRLRAKMAQFLQQGMHEHVNSATTWRELKALMEG
jgi:flagellum-specific ATP synthase